MILTVKLYLVGTPEISGKKCESKYETRPRVGFRVCILEYAEGFFWRKATGEVAIVGLSEVRGISS